MNSIDFETLIVIIFVLVDDWYQLETVIFQEMDGTIIPSSTAFSFAYPAYFD